MRRAVRILGWLLLLVTLTGCWSRRELTDVSFIPAMGVDLENGQLLVTINVLAPGKPGDGNTAQESKVKTITVRANSLDEAMSRMNQLLSRHITLAHVRAIVFGEEYARNGITPAIDFLLRSVEIRPTAWVALSVGAAKDLLGVRPSQELMPSEGPLGYQDVIQVRSGITPTRRITEVANILQEEGIDLTLPLFRRATVEHPVDADWLESAGNSHELIFGGAGVFKGDRLVAHLGADATRGALLPQGVPIRGAVVVPCEGGQAVFRMRRSDGKIKVQVHKQGVSADLHIKVIADLNESTCTGKVMEGDPHLLADLLGDKIESDVGAAIAVSRETGSDLMGLGQTLFRSSPHLYTGMEKRWDDLLQSASINVVVNPRVPRLGQTTRRYQIR